MRYGRWEILRELGQGGQGTAYLVRDTTKLDVDATITEFRTIATRFGGIATPEAAQRTARSALEAIETYLRRDAPENVAVLKLLHESARRDEKALARLRDEIDVLTRIEHPNIIRIVDASPADGWFVTPYYPEGPLSANLARFAGRLEEGLPAFRSLVSGVAVLHSIPVTHRDIKPENIFVSGRDLILGDFGIVYYEDAARTRVTDSYENVGSRDWMPGWAMGMRVDEVRPSFDVFSLGKVLWAMVSGRTKMRLWYFDHQDFDLARQFPNDGRMLWINKLLAGSVREHADDVWRTAHEFLEQLDAVLAILRRSGQVIAPNIVRYCRVCGYGIYDLVGSERNPAAVQNMGFNTAGSEMLRVFQCRNCGHLDLFRITHRTPAWTDIR